MADCISGIDIPILQVDPCNGKTINTKCVIHEDEISLLEIDANSSQYVINNAILVSMTSLLNRVDALELALADAESRILILES